MTHEDGDTRKTKSGIIVPGSWRQSKSDDGELLSRVSASDAEKLKAQGRAELEKEIRTALVEQIHERARILEEQRREQEQQARDKAHAAKIAAYEKALDLQKKIAAQNEQRARRAVANLQKAAAERRKEEARKEEARKAAQRRGWWPFGKK